MLRKLHVRFGGGPGEKAVMTSLAVYPTSCLAVRRESGMEECGNTLGVQAPKGIRLTRDSWDTTVVTQKCPGCPSLEGHDFRCLKPWWHLVSRLKWVPQLIISGMRPNPKPDHLIRLADADGTMPSANPH